MILFLLDIVMYQLLVGVCVFDFMCLLFGLVVMCYLVDFGVEVIKIEDFSFGDYVCDMMCIFVDCVVECLSLFFCLFNCGKIEMWFDLKCVEDCDVFIEFVCYVDVFIESFCFGVMVCFGVGWDMLCVVNFVFVMCFISGYGQDGLFV